MKISFSSFKQAQSLVNFPGSMSNMNHFIMPRQCRKEKVVVVIGSTGTGKSRFAIDLATQFNGEIINSDKIQVYKGLNIVTNKVTEEECRGIPHHLLGIINPEEDFTAEDFVYQASLSVEMIINRGKLPIIAGGSNSFIKALVIEDIEFRSKYECCFLWVDVSMPVLHSFVSKRVDQMVEAGLVEETREFFEPTGDYTKGIQRAIGVPEMHDFFEYKAIGQDDVVEELKLLEGAIDKIKSNTCELACRQLGKILMLGELLEWQLNHLDATNVFLKSGVELNEAWDRFVVGPGTKIVSRFLCKDHMDFASAITPQQSMVILGPSNATAVTAASR